MDSIYSPKSWALEHGAAPQSRAHEISDLRAISRAMDSQFKVGGFRFGWDGILGLIPGIGDVATSLVSIYIVMRAAALGASPSILMRMGLNVLIDNVFDAVPIFGQIFDFLWKSNDKNMVLLERHLQNPRATSRASALVVGFVILGIITALIALMALSIMAAVWIFEQFQTGAW
ncbi:MAG: DUF4112 domain-containing protein [Bdellovibrionaceae bacterium]|nr:DUF4112 domain-containing protein [Pseudobdellovibrionaceae bacterium]